MTYLPTTTLSISSWYYIALAVSIAITIIFLILSLKAWSKAPVAGYREPMFPSSEEPFYVLPYGKIKQVNDPVPVYDETNTATKKWNVLRAWTIFFALVTIIPGLALFNAHKAIDGQAERNLVENLGTKYGVTAFQQRTLGFSKYAKAELDPRRSEEQLITAKLNGKMDVFKITQDEITSEPTLYSGKFSVAVRDMPQTPVTPK